MRRTRVELLVCMSLSLAFVGCSTVDPGTNIVPPDLFLDEDVFYCVIQPQIIEAHGCADMGCHGDSTAFRLTPTAAPPTCVDGVLSGPVPGEYTTNFESVRTVVQSDPESRSFYGAPIGEHSHPHIAYEEGSDEAATVADWIVSGAGL